MHVCPDCGRAWPTVRGVAIHRAQAHGVGGSSASASYRALRGEGPTVARDRVDGGPVGLLIAVIEQARADAAYSLTAASWLADIRQGATR